MKKATSWVILVMILSVFLVGCLANRYPGQTFKLSKTFDVAFTDMLYYMGVVPGVDTLDYLIENPKWVLPEGIVISDTKITIASQKVTWEVRNEIQGTTTSYTGQGVRITVLGNVTIEKNYKGFGKVPFKLVLPGVISFALRSGTYPVVVNLTTPTLIVGNEIQIDEINVTKTKTDAVLKTTGEYIIAAIVIGVILVIAATRK